MTYNFKFKINSKGFQKEIAADNIYIAKQRFLQWVETQIVSIEPVKDNDNWITDFLKGHRK